MPVLRNQDEHLIVGVIIVRGRLIIGVSMLPAMDVQLTYIPIIVKLISIVILLQQQPHLSHFPDVVTLDELRGRPYALPYILSESVPFPGVIWVNATFQFGHGGSSSSSRSWSRSSSRSSTSCALNHSFKDSRTVASRPSDL